MTATSLISGESLLKSLRNGVIAGIQAYAFNAIGNVPLDGVENVIGVAIFHGAISGLGAGFQGGDAGSAFLAGFLTKGTTVATAGYIQDIDNLVIESVIYGTIGGTISNVTGGSFANGATTAAIGYIFNQAGPRRTQGENLYRKRTTFSEALDEALARAKALRAQIERSKPGGNEFFDKDFDLSFFRGKPIGGLIFKSQERSFLALVKAERLCFMPLLKSISSMEPMDLTLPLVMGYPQFQ